MSAPRITSRDPGSRARSRDRDREPVPAARPRARLDAAVQHPRALGQPLEAVAVIPSPVPIPVAASPVVDDLDLGVGEARS